MSNLSQIDKNFKSILKKRGMLSVEMEQRSLTAGEDVFQMDLILLKVQKKVLLQAKNLNRLERKKRI